MYTSVLVVFSFVISAHCVTTRSIWQSPDLNISKVLPVNPVKVQCSLTDIIILAAPLIASKRPKYKLYNPQGDYRILKIHSPKFKNKRVQNSEIEIFSFNKTKVIVPKNKFRIFNVNKGYEIGDNTDVFEEKQKKRESTDVFGENEIKRESKDVFGEKDMRELKDVFSEKEKKMGLNEFMIGPVGVEDYGNWILNMLYQQDGEWVEFYQVISVDILEYVPPLWNQPVLAEGDTFNLSFAYPMRDIQSCQLIAPASTFDRFYDRQDVNMDTCGYVVTNVTAEDAGLWKIIAVGRITYATAVNLTVVSFTKLSGY